MNTSTTVVNDFTIEVLNDLIQIHNDRITGYTKAIEELKPEDSDLKPLFADLISESESIKASLISNVQSAGGSIDTDTTASGKIYRAWMDVKAFFTGHTRHAVLASCEGGEDAAQKAYRTALESDDISGALKTELASQQQTLRASHDRIKALRDQAA
ncbi:PA2169 family four-helix-bundle protein [Filimonas effusa]|uniref:PA2169 family four-helix-bundle protein n=1 Tax=Filimonas effusa TaxID=2508721 RepID=A0A4Q1D0G1_9BACT|nr:PA2169 family four-helix-bundle protein [Filimonas effusa]RXK81233.1 PA2169 family four-helix-bundle protein [Filimonas effusa]